MAEKHAELPTLMVASLRGCRANLHKATDDLSEVLTRPDNTETPGRMLFVARDVQGALNCIVEAIAYYAEAKNESEVPGG